MRSLPIMILAIMIFSITSVYAAVRTTEFTEDGSIIVYPDNPDMAADYKVNYAIMNPEEFSKSKILIYPYDIQFVQRALKISQESCTQNGRPDCADRVKEYQDALATMTNMQAQQTGSTPTSTPSVSPADGEKKKSGALSQLSAWAKQMKDLLKDILDKIRQGLL